MLREKEPFTIIICERRIIFHYWQTKHDIILLDGSSEGLFWITANNVMRKLNSYKKWHYRRHLINITRAFKNGNRSTCESISTGVQRNSLNYFLKKPMFIKFTITVKSLEEYLRFVRCPVGNSTFIKGDT